jgi:hypothetical protein
MSVSIKDDLYCLTAHIFSEIRKIKIVKEGIDEMKRSKDQKLSTINLPFLGAI